MQDYLEVFDFSGTMKREREGRELKREIEERDREMKKDRERKREEKAKKEQWEREIGYKNPEKYWSCKVTQEVAKEYNKEIDFVASARAGDLKGCKLFIEQGTNINANNYLGTALGMAARKGKIEVCKFLIHYKANIDLYDYYGQTPLMHAAGYGNIDICKLLIENGANVNVTRGNLYYNQTIREYENVAKYPEIISLLEEHGLKKIENKEKNSFESESVVYADVSLSGEEYIEDYGSCAIL